MGRRSKRVAVGAYDEESLPKRRSRKNSHIDTSDVVVPIQPNRRKSFHLKDLKKVSPLTDNQRKAFNEWDDDQNLVLDGYAGTGKTYIALYLALRSILDNDTPQDKIIIAKTPVQGFAVGFLPGELDEKIEPFEAAYKSILDDFFPWTGSYNNLKEAGKILFDPMVAIRGKTFDNAIIVVDEIQNMTAQQIETIITRCGINTRIILCGDDCQNDIGKQSGLREIIPILRRMFCMSFVDFQLTDIVRSGLVRDFLTAKYSKY